MIDYNEVIDYTKYNLSDTEKFYTDPQKIDLGPKVKSIIVDSLDSIKVNLTKDIRAKTLDMLTDYSFSDKELAFMDIKGFVNAKKSFNKSKRFLSILFIKILPSVFPIFLLVNYCQESTPLNIKKERINLSYFNFQHRLKSQKLAV